MSSDDALLARLNALRASTVTLSQSDAPLSIPKPIKPPQDNLSSRLKALRTASESSKTSVPRPSSPPPTPAPISPKGNGPRLSLSSPHHEHVPLSPPNAGDVKGVFDDASRQAESLASDLKGTKLFDRNADEDLKLAREATQAADEVGKAIKTKLGDEENITGKDDKVESLRGDAAKALERARKTLEWRDGRVPVDSDDEGQGNDGDSDDQHAKKQKLSDDSDDDNGSKKDEDEEADALLAELMDDVALDFEEDSRRGLHGQESPVGSPSQLPPPPSLITPVAPTSPKSKDSAGGDGQDEKKDDTDDEDEFRKKMKERMSALRTPSPGLDLPAAPSSEPVGSLGLPSAPVDQLSKLSVSKTPKEDYICKICYDKATIFCEGCEEEFEEWDTKDDAMYCARCWKESHLGETADEEERGHQWVTVRRGK